MVFKPVMLICIVEDVQSKGNGDVSMSEGPGKFELLFTFFRQAVKVGVERREDGKHTSLHYDT
jgi:hypothetical protein